MKIEQTERANTSRLKPCPYCKDSWLYVSDGDYGSGYESKGYRVECQCGFAWKSMGWKKNKEEAIKEWNGVKSEVEEDAEIH